MEDNQVRVRFVNSPIVNNVHVTEFSDSIVIVIATISSVHRLYLPHPKTTNRSVLADLTSDVLFNPSNYYIIGGHGSTNTQHPISASACFAFDAIITISSSERKILLTHCYKIKPCYNPGPMLLSSCCCCSSPAQRVTIF